MNGYLEDEVIEDVRSTFLLAMERIHRVLGKDAFRFEPKESGTRRPINMLLFETLTYLFTFEEADNKMVRPLINEWKKKIDKTGGAFRESVDASSNVNARFENVEEVRELIRMLE